MQTYYFILFVFSALLTGAYMLIWKKHYDVHLTLVFGVIPVTNLGFLLQAQAKTTEAALFATRFAYIGGCFLQLFIMLTIFSLCGIRVPKTLRVIFAGLSAALFPYGSDHRPEHAFLPLRRAAGDQREDGAC